MATERRGSGKRAARRLVGTSEFSNAANMGVTTKQKHWILEQTQNEQNGDVAPSLRKRYAHGVFYDSLCCMWWHMHVSKQLGG